MVLPLDCQRSHHQKRMRQLKKLAQRQMHDPEKENSFELFLATTRVRWTYYKETENVLGQTFGMCVLQVRKQLRCDELHAGVTWVVLLLCRISRR
jgi:tRNA(Met) C34 N-acetyltransferase TmcA